MKKLSLLTFIILTLQGCAGLGEDAQKSYENVVNETGQVINKVNETKDKAKETIDDINNAVSKIEETKDAIKEVTE